jgi:hypothetical protein
MDYGKNLILKHDPVSPKDVEQNLLYYKDLFGMAGLTINEIRKMENFDPLPYDLADAPILNLGGTAIRIDTDEQLGAVPNNVPLNNTQEDTSKIFSPKFDSKTQKVEKGVLDLHWKQFNRKVNLDLKWFERRINEFFDGQKERLFNRLNIKDALTDTFFEMEDEMLLLMNMIENGYLRFLERGFGFSGANYVTNLISEGQKNQFLNYSKNINKTTRDRVNAKLKSGGDPKQILSELYEDFKSGRSPLIAETTGVSGFNAGLWAGYRNQGYKYKTWISQRDEKVRHSHFLAEGQKVKIDEHFVLGTELLMYPGDPTASPEETINCRCTIIGEK